MIWAEYSRSEIARTLTRDVPLSMEMTWLPVGGRTTRIAWGRMTRRMSLPPFIPSARAASCWPLSTEPMPPRMISAM